MARRSPPPGHGATGLLTLSTFSRGYERNYQHISSETTPPQNTNTQSVLSRARAHSEEISPRQGYTQPASAKGGRGLSWGAAGGGGWGRGDTGPPAARGWPGQVLAGLRGRRCAVYGVVKTLHFLPSLSFGPSPIKSNQLGIAFPAGPKAARSRFRVRGLSSKHVAQSRLRFLVRGGAEAPHPVA